MKSIVLVCDLAENFLNNRIFSEEMQRKFPWGESFWIHLKEKCDQENIEIVTADLFLKYYDSKYVSHKSYLISNMTNPFTSILLSKVSVPLIIYSLESPNVAVRFYANIRKLATRFKYSILFQGVSRYVASSNSNHLTLYWPNTYKSVQECKDWVHRDFLCFISSNKSKYDVIPNKPLKWVRLLLKRIYLIVLPFRFPFLRSVDLYDFRYKAIDYFIANDKFKLFGVNWNKQNSLPNKLFKKISKANPQQVESKIATLGQHRFALCFENCRYPGYITEKIFDCFFAGTIPVYFGAPDIDKFIPKNTFIDYRDFNSFEHLENHLLNLSVTEAEKYITNASEFLSSDQFSLFTDTKMADKIYQIIINESK